MDSVTRFRFRDPTNSDTTSDGSSVSSTDDDDDESRLESMTGKGIKRLCSELLELKKASDEDFHRNVYSNYSTFVRIFKEVGTMDNELVQLKQHVLTQRKLVKDLMDDIYVEMLSEESIESIIEESVVVDKYPLNKFETRTNAISETLDILLLEHRLDEALAILEVGVGSLKRIQLEEDPPMQVLVSSDSAILERKTRLADQFAVVADHPRVTAPEFRKALVGLRRLGENQRATQLLLKFYRSRLANGIHDLQCLKQSFHGTYIRELAKFVFSVISQGAKSYEVLYGEKSPYTSEFIQWAREETEVFVCCFSKYVKSISEINGGLSTAVEAVQLAVSFCSLLESQSIMLKPYLVKLMRPCMEEVLKMHIDHFKKVIGIFTATDAWILGKYLISGILKEEASPMIIGHQLQYCLLTSSGRKFITMMQAIMKEVSPLVVLQMEFSILNGLMDLFRDYIGILITVIPGKADIAEKGSYRIILAQTLTQQLSVIANSSAIVHIFSSTARSIFKNIDGHPMTHHVVTSQQKELNNWIFSIQEMADRLRDYFCEQFIHRVMFLEEASRLPPETYVDDQRDSDTFQELMPSVAFQVLFQELRKLEKLGKDILIGADWLVEELLREVVKSIFVWLSNSQDFWTTIEDRPIVHVQQSQGVEQFVLDMQFLVEITKLGGYFCESMVDDSLALIHRMESAFVFAGLVPERDILTDEWATNAANEATDKLLLNEKTKLLTLEEPSRNFEEDAEEQRIECSSPSAEEDSVELDNELVTKSVITDTDKETPKLEMTPSTESLEHSEPEVHLDDEDTQRNTSSLVDSSEDMGAANATDAAIEELEGIEKTEVQGAAGIVEEASEEKRETATVPPEEGAIDTENVPTSSINELEDGNVAPTIEGNGSETMQLEGQKS